MKRSILPAACFLMTLTVAAWNDTSVSGRDIALAEAITLARTQSVDAAVALNELKATHWGYRTFCADSLPEVNFTRTLLNYNKPYSTYQSLDNSYSFARNNILGLSGALPIDQNIWFVGDKLSLASSLDYIKQLGPEDDKQFVFVPVGLELTQPVFGVSSLKWDRRVELARYAKAKAVFIPATEEVTMKTITCFLELLLTREALATAQQNEANSDRLYKVTIARRKVGQILESDLLQLKLNSLQDKADVTEVEGTLDARIFQLRSPFGVSESEGLNPVIPVSVSGIKMDYNRVLNKALERSLLAQNIRHRQLKADCEAVTVCGNLRNIDLFTSAGYIRQNHEFSSAYRDLLDNQVVKAGVKIPILDWGKRRGKAGVAKSSREVTLSKTRQEQMDFDQDTFLLMTNFNNRVQQLNTVEGADLIIEKRYRTGMEAFTTGKISTPDLNDAQEPKNEARQKYVSEFYYHWHRSHQLRSLTLWDSKRNMELEADLEDIIRGQTAPQDVQSLIRLLPKSFC